MTHEIDEALEQFTAAVRTGLLPKLEESAAVVSLVPDGDGDIKFAVETGLAILLDKPIIAMVLPGRQIPAKLAKVADRVIEADLSTAQGRTTAARDLKKALAEVTGPGDHTLRD